MWIAETIDLDNHDSVVKFMRNQSDKIKKLEKENEQLKQQIKDLRIGVLDSIHEADEIQCTCNPCVVEECVKRWLND